MSKMLILAFAMKMMKVFRYKGYKFISLDRDPTT